MKWPMCTHPSRHFAAGIRCRPELTTSSAWPLLSTTCIRSPLRHALGQTSDTLSYYCPSAPLTCAISHGSGHRRRSLCRAITKPRDERRAVAVAFNTRQQPPQQQIWPNTSPLRPNRITSRAFRRIPHLSFPSDRSNLRQALYTPSYQ